MRDPLTITCPVCGESFDITIDGTEGDSEFVIDCEICCRPMNIKLTVRDQEIEDIQITAD